MRKACMFQIGHTGFFNYKPDKMCRNTAEEAAFATHFDLFSMLRSPFF